MSDAPLLLLMGPTASGKSALALELARELDGEIVSVDSAQVYRGMDIGTAKPDAATRAAVSHHLLDLLDPSEAYSAARFCTDALRVIAEIRARGRVPILCGGTWLYFRALTEGLSELPSADASVRAQLEAEARSEGWPALHARLAVADPASAARLHPNDQQRIQRALEIITVTGLTPTQFYAQGAPQPAWPGAVRKIALHPPARAVLHERIALRFAQMMKEGFLDEVRALHQRGDLNPNLPSLRSVGYRQLWAHLEGEGTLEQSVQRAIEATRQFAKRQITWLRSERDVKIFDPAAADLLKCVLQHIG